MQRMILMGAILAGLLCQTRAAVAPAAERLLPGDTVAMITVPDWDKAARSVGNSAHGQLWAEPALKPFRDHFVKRFTDEVLPPLEKQLGIKLSDYNDLAQ